MLGVVILIIGVLILLSNLGLITGSIWGFFWPLLLVAVGLVLIFKRKSCWGKWHKHAGEMHENFHEKEGQ
jgi:hypothetical protein